MTDIGKGDWVEGAINFAGIVRGRMYFILDIEPADELFPCDLCGDAVSPGLIIEPDQLDGGAACCPCNFRSFRKPLEQPSQTTIKRSEPA